MAGEGDREQAVVDEEDMRAGGKRVARGVWMMAGLIDVEEMN